MIYTEVQGYIFITYLLQEEHLPLSSLLDKGTMFYFLGWYSINYYLTDKCLAKTEVIF